MVYRVSDASSSSVMASRINTQRGRMNILEERLTTGKRINRPSDDPAGAQAVLNMRTTQTEIEQFKVSARAASQKLIAADDSLNGYQTILDRVQVLVAQGLSDTTTQQAKNAIATELDSLRGRILNLANGKNGEDYLYGGTRQNAAPFDPVTAAPAATPTVAQHIQIEPGTNAIATGATADQLFSDATSTIFTDLTNAAAALRGTGNAATDRATIESTVSRLSIYRDQASAVQARVGANMNAVDIAVDNLTVSSMSLGERASEIEGADFAETALAMSETQRALDAVLQVAARGRRSLFDFMG